MITLCTYYINHFMQIWYIYKWHMCGKMVNRSILGAWLLGCLLGRIMWQKTSKHDKLSHCWFNVGPASTTQAPHWTSNWTMSRFFLGLQSQAKNWVQDNIDDVSVIRIFRRQIHQLTPPWVVVLGGGVHSSKIKGCYVIAVLPWQQYIKPLTELVHS